MKKIPIITFANIKGGVGKTTAAVNIAYLLATELGKKVLVIDADDQGNASKSLGATEDFDPETETLWYALKNKKAYSEVMVPAAYDNIHVVPSTKELKAAQLTFGQSARGMRLFQRLLKGVEKDFDFVLIDTKPQINILLQAALAASSWYLIPSFPEPDSYDGFIDLLAEAEEIQDEVNEDLRCLGVLLTSVKKIPAHETYMTFISKHMRKAKVPMFKAFVRNSNAMATGSLHGCPASALPGAYAIRGDYLKVVKALVRSVGKASSKVPAPDLSVLGIDSFSGEDGLEVSARSDQIEL